MKKQLFAVYSTFQLFLIGILTWEMGCLQPGLGFEQKLHILREKPEGKGFC